MCSQPNEGLYDTLLPKKVEVLLQRLPKEIKEVDKTRGHFHKDTTIINAQIQKWRNKKNPIGFTSLTSSVHEDFIIFNPYVEKGAFRASLIKDKQTFVAYFPISLLGEVCKDPISKILHRPIGRGELRCVVGVPVRPYVKGVEGRSLWPCMFLSCF